MRRGQAGVRSWQLHEVDGDLFSLVFRRPVGLIACAGTRFLPLKRRANLHCASGARILEPLGSTGMLSCNCPARSSLQAVVGNN